MSDRSVEKDTETLRELHGHAGIPEYWRVEARMVALAFDTLGRRTRGHVSTQKQGG